MTAPQPSLRARTEGDLFVEVAVPRPLDQRFTYRVPAGLRSEVEEGSVVRVPFGRSRVMGVVTTLLDRSEHPRLKDIEELVAAPYRIDAGSRELAAWIADYYASSEGEALQLMLPPRPGTKARRLPWKVVEGAERVVQRLLFD